MERDCQNPIKLTGLVDAIREEYQQDRLKEISTPLARIADELIDASGVNHIDECKACRVVVRAAVTQTLGSIVTSIATDEFLEEMEEEELAWENVNELANLLEDSVEDSGYFPEDGVSVEEMNEVGRRVRIFTKSMRMEALAASVVAAVQAVLEGIEAPTEGDRASLLYGVTDIVVDRLAQEVEAAVQEAAGDGDAGRGSTYRNYLENVIAGLAPFVGDDDDTEHAESQ